MDNTYKLILGDCLTELAKLPEKSVNLILTDLPFGTTNNKWDSVLPHKLLWPSFYRVLKNNGAIVLCCQQPFSSYLILSNIDRYKYSIYWQKLNASGFLNAKIMPLKSIEEIVIFNNVGKITYNPQMGTGKPYHSKQGRLSENFNESILGYENINTGTRYPQDFIPKDSIKQYANTAGKFHPNEKPESLMEYLIKTYSNEGDLVLDATMGSGTTVLAAYNTNRSAIGIDNSYEYYQVALNRITGNTDLTVKELT